jgi:hypothetical protein
VGWVLDARAKTDECSRERWLPRAVDMFQRGKHYDWGQGEWAFAMYATTANIGMLLANNFILAILGDAYSNQVRALYRCAVRNA